MTRVVQLGCGFHGRGIAYQLAAADGVDLTVLDLNGARAAEVGDKAGVASGTVDVTDAGGLRAAVEGADLVVNAVGPYHRTALGIVEAALGAGAHYVDMNDDHEVAEALLVDSWDERARRAGLTALLDCGVVPGLSGMLVRHAADRLDETERVAVRFGWNYNRAYPAAIQHFLRINSGGGLQLVEGELVRMPPFESCEEVEFHEPVGRVGVYFTGVPDPVAIARFVPGVRSATAKGAFYQDAANDLVREMIRWGFTSYEPPAEGLPGPLDYLVAYLGSPQGERWFEIPRRELPLALRVEVEGRRAGEPVALRYEVHDHSRRATTTFTALAALAVARGELESGVLTPEAWPDAAGFLQTLLADPDIRISHWCDSGPAEALAFD